MATKLAGNGQAILIRCVRGDTINIMQFLRHLGLGLSVSVFSLLLVVFAAALTTYAVLDRPAPLKNALQTSGIYNVFVSRTLAEKQAQGEIDVPATGAARDAINRAVQDALSPSFVQQTAERSVDQAYAWLHGKTPQLGLAINANDAKQRFADSIAAYVQQKATSLPVCTQAVPVPTTLDELLALNCRPAVIPPALLAAAARQEALKTQFFDQLVLTTNNLQDEQGRPLSEKLEAVPRAHRYFMLSLYIMPAVLLLCALAIIFCSATRRGGMKRVGHMLLWAGVFNIGWALAITWILTNLSGRLTSTGEAAAFESNVLRIVDSLAAGLRTWWVAVGIAYVLIGIALFVTVRLLNKRTVHDVEALNKSLGYADVPSAGTTFDPDKKPSEPGDKLVKPKPEVKSADTEQTKNPPK